MNNLKAKCPICGWRGFQFLTFDGGYGQKVKNTTCPVCDSHPRHRLIYLYLSSFFKKELQNSLKKSQKLKVLHFSPSACLLRYFLSINHKIDYLTVDIVPGRAMQVEDITNLSFQNDQFDLILCVHILEHVEKDSKAMQEVKRVLKPGGRAIIDVPIDMEKTTTYENPKIITPEERTKAFWQFDHVRLYGRDFPEKLKAEGFIVKIYNSQELMSKNEFKLYALYDRPLIVCTKGGGVFNENSQKSI